MSDPAILFDVLLRGLAIGALLLLGISSIRAGIPRNTQLVMAAFAVSVAGWLLQSPTLLGAISDSQVLMPLAASAAGFFWLMVTRVFEDRALTPLSLAPPVALVVIALGYRAPAPIKDWAWVAQNGLSALLALDALIVVARGWRGDLIEGRRRMRAHLLALSAIFVVATVGFGFLGRADPRGPWLAFTGSGPFGGAVVSLMIFAMAAMFLQVRTEVFGASRQLGAAPDSRLEAAERVLHQALAERMTGGAWRQEGLTIGALADALGAPEHQVRRLINRRLGFRNFADFVNSYRIETAKARLADPAEARTTIAAIAFDLGYASLGPFYRAFRLATGESPTEWRKRVLGTAPIPEKAV